MGRYAVPGQADLVVMGGGSAGSVSALLAARDGPRVLLVDPDRTTPRLEGMSPRLRQWLQGLGLLEGFPGLAGPFRRETAWSGLSQAANGEYVVERAALDRWLRNAAQMASVEFVRTTCRPGRRCHARGWRCHPAPRIIDARGRNAHRERKNRGPATLAICGWASAVGIQPGIRIAAIEQGAVAHCPSEGACMGPVHGRCGTARQSRRAVAARAAQSRAGGIRHRHRGASARTRSRAVAAMFAGRSSHPARRGCAGCHGSPVGARSVLGSIECPGRSGRSALSGRAPR